MTRPTGFVEDLDLIGGLDFTPVCEYPDPGACSVPATFAMWLRTLCCGASQSCLLCVEHVKETCDGNRIAAKAVVTCSGCDRTAPLSQLLVIDRVEAI